MNSSEMKEFDDFKINELKNFDKKNVEKLLECPVCLDICIPPIFVCETGHHICEKCIKAVRKCVTCSAKFKGTRSFFFENFFDQCNFSCYYVREGCKQTLKGQDLKIHQETRCDFRPLVCISCSKSVPYSKYLDHSFIHSSIRKYIIPGEFEDTLPLALMDIERNKAEHWPPRPLMFVGLTFFGMIYIRSPLVGIWVSLFGNEEEARKFYVQISIGTSIGNPNTKKFLKRPKFSLTWEGPVHAIRSSAQTIMDEGKCLVTSIAFIHTICRSKKDVESTEMEHDNCTTEKKDVECTIEDKEKTNMECVKGDVKVNNIKCATAGEEENDMDYVVSTSEDEEESAESTSEDEEEENVDIIATKDKEVEDVEWIIKYKIIKISN